MQPCVFVSDLHGRIHRYEKLFATIAAETPRAVFLGGDLLPSGRPSPTAASEPQFEDFLGEYLVPRLQSLREQLGDAYPRIFVILGNDDRRSEEPAVIAAAVQGVWEYAHERRAAYENYAIYGYACVPPTPFMYKDWERYDVSRYVDPGCIQPEEGAHGVPFSAHEILHATMRQDLARLVGDDDLRNAIMLFHSPPYQTVLDRAALDGKMIDHLPLDVHVGSIAIRRFIEARRPLICLHGHVHESTRLTGAWSQQIGPTHCFSAAHDGPELAVVQFDPADPARATRVLI